PRRLLSESNPAAPSLRRRWCRFRARSEICVRPTRWRASAVGNNGQSPRQHKSAAKSRKAFITKENAPAAQPPERLKITFPNLANLRAQKPAVIFDSYLTATEQIGHGGDGFAAAFSAGTNGEN